MRPLICLGFQIEFHPYPSRSFRAITHCSIVKKYTINRRSALFMFMIKEVFHRNKHDEEGIGYPKIDIKMVE